jgi:hypothetical protein
MIIEQSQRKYSLFKIPCCYNSGPTVEPCAVPVPVNLPSSLVSIPRQLRLQRNIHIFALLPKETLPQLFKQFIQIVNVL